MIYRLKRRIPWWLVATMWMAVGSAIALAAQPFFPAAIDSRVASLQNLVEDVSTEDSVTALPTQVVAITPLERPECPLGCTGGVIPDDVGQAVLILASGSEIRLTASGSLPAFRDAYNGRYLSGLRAYEETVEKHCEVTLQVEYDVVRGDYYRTIVSRKPGCDWEPFAMPTAELTAIAGQHVRRLGSN